MTYSTTTATSRTTKLTSDIMKLNFMTDQGSKREICRCALRGDLLPSAALPDSFSMSEALGPLSAISRTPNGLSVKGLSVNGLLIRSADTESAGSAATGHGGMLAGAGAAFGPRPGR